MATTKLLEPKDSIAYRAIRLEALKKYPEYFGSGYEQQLQLEKLYFERLIEEGSEKGKMAGVFIDDQLVGICGVTFETKVLPNAGEIIQMYVKPEYQNKGFGKSLMKKIEDICTSSAISTALLEVVINNSSAIKVYEQSSYKINESLSSDQNTVYMTLAMNQ